jgi:hypothetical protein
MSKQTINNLPQYLHTKMFLGMKYYIGSGNLSIGDKCWVHPTERSKTKDKYKVIIFEREWELSSNRVDEPTKSIEISTWVKGGYAALLNMDLFVRLEKIQ